MKRMLGFLLAAGLSYALAAPAAMAGGSVNKQVAATKVKPTISSSLKCTSKRKVLLLQDVLPWGNNSNEQVLEALDVNYIVANSDQFATILAPARLAKCHTVIVAGNQTSGFYHALAPYKATLTSWTLFPQHTLVFHGADSGEDTFWSFALPLNLTHQNFFAYDNTVANPGSPLANNMPSYFYDTDMQSVSNGFFDLGAVGPSNVVLETNRKRGDSVPAAEVDLGPLPTMVDYCYVLGRIIASTTTQEYYFPVANADWAVILLWNELWLATQKPGCQPKAMPPYPPSYLFNDEES